MHFVGSSDMHGTENVKFTVVLREIRSFCTRLWQRSGGVTERSVSSCKSLISNAACRPYWNICQLELLSANLEVTSWCCPHSKHCRFGLSRYVTGDDKILILEFIMTRNVKMTVFWNMTPCSLVDWNQRFIGYFYLRTSIQGFWEWRDSSDSNLPCGPAAGIQI